MWKNHSEIADEDTDTAQPSLSEFVTPECPVCGRVLSEATDPCHTDYPTEFREFLDTTDWLLSSSRPDEPGCRTDEGIPVSYVLGSDKIEFACLYAVVRDLMEPSPERFNNFIDQTPYEIPAMEWVSSIYERDLKIRGGHYGGPIAAINVIEDRFKQTDHSHSPSDTFARLIYLDQFQLIPSFQAHYRKDTLRELCADHYDVPMGSLDSKWLVERRVDRSKVSSTTEAFRQKFDLALVGETPGSHPFAAYKPFNGKSVLGDHRDHNLLVKEAKHELDKLEYIDWTLAPHIIYSQDGYDASSEESSGKLPILGFDFAGFQSTSAGETMQHLGIVTDREESNFEIYLQVVQMAKTHANGLIVMCDRKSIYRFLHYLQENRLIAESKRLPDTIDDYHAIPNVEALHNDVINHIPLFEDIAILPRRKFRDEGLQTISDLISVETDA